MTLPVPIPASLECVGDDVGDGVVSKCRSSKSPSASFGLAVPFPWLVTKRISIVLPLSRETLSSFYKIVCAMLGTNGSECGLLTSLRCISTSSS